MRVDLVSTGDEVLLGDILDTNSAHAASLLSDHDFVIGRQHTCGDDLAELTAVFGQALSEADAVISCGGLGPTRDDLTAEAAAAALGVELTTDSGLLDDLRHKLRDLGVELTANQERQARLPAGARALDNPVGTAPGIATRQGDKLMFCLPGPPAEYRPMLSGPVLQGLEEARKHGGSRDVLARRVLRVFGKGEGFVESTLGDLQDQVPGLRVGFQAVLPEILIKLRARAPTREQAEAVLEAGESLARDKLGDLIYAPGDTSLAAVVLALLAEQGKTLAVAESCTGGLVGKLLTDVPGSSSVFVLSAVTYTNEMKERLLGVPGEILATHGAVSAPAAQAMAEGVRKLAGAGVGVAVTGIAGPEGGTADKPVGTVFFAIADERGTITKYRRFPFRDRAFVRSVSAHAALALVRLRSIQQPTGAGGPAPA